MSAPKSIRYNDTMEYEYVTCFTTFGVFTGERIDQGSLPQDFCTYYITAGKDGIVSKILPARASNPKREIFGTFISKEEIPGKASKLGVAMDWTVDVTVHADQEFNFEEFFGFPPSLECQIADAYRRQEIQLMAAKAKKRPKDKPMDHHQNRDR